MRRQDTQSLAEILNEVLKENNIDNHLYEMELIDAWYKMLGSTIKKHTTKIYVSNHKLFVGINSSVLKHDLSMSRTSLTQSLNKEVGKEVINDIIFL